MTTPGTQAWLDSIQEPIIDADRPIIDPHHHLWHSPGINGAYLHDNLWADTDSGHKIEKTVFIECGANYHKSGPEHLRSVGETEFVAAQAQLSREQNNGQQAQISGIVAHTDLRLPNLEEVMASHAASSTGLLRGIRHAGARDPHPQALMIAGRAPQGLYADPDFRRGVALLGQLGYSFDTWHYHHQNADFAALAQAAPDTTMVLDHFGTPLGVGPYATEREAIFKAWQQDIATIAGCSNVVAKLGGLAMPDNGFGWHEGTTPPNSDACVAAQARYYHHTIECFGPERCMFESNFPVDRLSLSYPILWNGLKKIAASYSDSEQHAMFYGTAERVYRLAE